MTAGVSLNFRHTQALYSDAGEPLNEALFPIVPLDSVGMPPAGPDFIAHANMLGDEIATPKNKKTLPVGPKLTRLYRRALYDPTFTLPVLLKSGTEIVTFLPGHLIKYGIGDLENAQFGPKPARVMIVSKIPGLNELQDQSAVLGPIAAPLLRALHAAGVAAEEYQNWYITFACKFASPTTDTPAVPAAWFKNCAVLLAQEIRLVRPDFILCLGAEATKIVLGITGGVSDFVGRPVDLATYDAAGQERTVKVMSVTHPALVVKKPEVYEDFASQIAKFKDLIDDKVSEAESVDHADIYTEAALIEMVDEMLADPDLNANIIAVDCEWHGEYPTEDGAYLRTIQVSNKDKWARTIVLRHQGGTPAFKPDLDAARTQLRRLLQSTPNRHVRVGGHFLRADMPWLIDFGLDLRSEYGPHADPSVRTQGGWDTSLMYHAVNECARYGLDVCSLRFTAAPTYWDELNKWRKRHRAQHKIKSTEIGGYGECPAYVLHPYGSYDADVTRRIMMTFYGSDGTDGLLAKDARGQDCWTPYWTAHSSSLAFLEMELTGLVVDRVRADELTTLFMTTQERLLREIRNDLQWPDFNPKSQPQLAVALFGRKYATRYTNPPAIPDAAQPLDMTPVKTTGKRPVLWADLRWRSEDPETATPSTDKESLGILGHRNTIAAKIRDYKFISQVLQSVLRKPALDEDGEYEIDDNGNYTYEKGLVGCVHADGNVRTHFFQTKETGRASSSRPPLQNLSSRRETDYARILGQHYQHPVRSILRVPPGHVGIETDFTGAELAVLAWLSQDENMIDHVRRNLLPEDHPDHYDIHSQQAVKTFHITDCPPTSTGLKNAGKKSLRIAAKNVNFGIPYGRGAEALARQCKEEGHEVTADQCQAMIESYFASYPKTRTFLAECRARSQDPGWLVGPYGRYRRFSPSKDRAVRGEQERQAQNFPIQGGVADAVSIALANFYQYRANNPDIDYKIVMQIHDAIVLVVPMEHVERVYNEVIPLCMVETVPFIPRRLDGEVISAGPYYFGSSREVFVHWGETLSRAQAADLGLHFLA